MGGDAIVVGVEQCDDGDIHGVDSCDDTCHIVTSYDTVASAAATSSSMVMASSSVSAVAGMVNVQPGFDMWMSVNFIQLSRAMTLVSHTNQPITQLLLDGLDMFTLDYDITRSIVNTTMSHTDMLVDDLDSLWHTYGITSTSFMHYAVIKAVIIVPMLVGLTVLTAACKAVSLAVSCVTPVY